MCGPGARFDDSTETNCSFPDRLDSLLVFITV